MSNYIFIGGLPRNGTNTTATFLHLNNNTFVIGYTAGIGDTNFINKLNTIYLDEYAQILHGGATLEYDKYRKYIHIKNETFKNKLKNTFENIAVRADYCVSGLSDGYNRKFPWIIDNKENIKVVFPIRNNLEDIFFSFLWHGMLGREIKNITNRHTDIFKNKLYKTFDSVINLKNNGISILVCYLQDKDFFSKVLSFLNIIPSILQQQVIEDGFITNQNNNGLSTIATTYALQNNIQNDRETYLRFVAENRNNSVVVNGIKDLKSHAFWNFIE